MKSYQDNQLTDEQRSRLRIRPWTEDRSMKETVAAICLDVKQRGDEALKEYSWRFDAVPATNFIVDSTTIEAAHNLLPASLMRAIAQATRNIRSFHNAQTGNDRPVETEPGVTCWREQRAIDTVGLYVPAGSAPLPSTVLMLGIPAMLAGCRRIVLASPPRKNGQMDPAVLAAAAHIGITEIILAGGAQAIAALAYGTASVPRVDKIFGPGNQYVTEAKRFVSADPDGAAIDLLAGPSELLILADDSAPPRVLAADLLSQAEHDPQSQVVLVTTSELLAQNTLKELAQQLPQLHRASIASRALENSFVLVVPSLKRALAFSNEYAPEHLMVCTNDPAELVPGIQNAGSVFLGPYAPVTAGDYASGTNHTLPTGGTSRWFSGLSVESFRKSITFQSITRDGLVRLSPALTAFAEAEGLDAHARAVAARLNDGAAA